MTDAVRQIITKESPLALYRGLVPTLIQIAPQTGFQFGFYSLLTSIWELVFGVRDKQLHRVGKTTTAGVDDVCGRCAHLVMQGAKVRSSPSYSETMSLCSQLLSAID